MNADDYKVEADTNLSMALAYSDGYVQLSVTEILAIAQVNATLHLANQKHIANLLAYQALHPNSHTDLDNYVADQIWEAMGA